MSRETTFKKGAFVGGYEFSSAERLSEDIAKKEADVNYYKQKLLAMACATPIDVTPAGQDPLEHVKFSFDEVFDELQEQLFQLHTLYVVQLNEENIDNGEDE